MRTRTKICGIAREEDARHASRAGADAIGMILAAKSPRLIEPDHAQKIVKVLSPFVARVGVFADASPSFIAQCARTVPLDYVQLHGRETIDHVRALASFRVIKAIKLEQLPEWTHAPANLAALLIDTGGGSGIENDYDALERALQAHPPAVPLILAGGLRPENVAGVVRRFRPYAVDVSSGVESSVAKKDPTLVEEFIAHATR